MFESDLKARTDLSSGTLYAVTGEGSWIYYGQVMPDKRIGFFNRRDRVVAGIPDIVDSEVMAQVGVNHRSIGAALRAGSWKKLGRFDVHTDLLKSRAQVQWPVDTLIVTVWSADGSYDTSIDDPSIQELEIIASWDAEYHIPKRLAADFGQEQDAWHVGGTVLRQRRMKEEIASRSQASWHQLPSNWVFTTVCKTLF